MNDLATMAWEHDAEFAALSDKGRQKTRARCWAMERILSATKRGRAEKNEAQHLGVGWSTVRLWVKNFLQSGGDWKVLVDYRAEKIEEQGLPKEFRDFAQMLYEDNQRNTAQAIKKLSGLYHSHATYYQKDADSKRIELWPGYTDEKGFHFRPAPKAKTGLPKGWSKRNLYRHKSTKLEETLARLGPVAASQYMAKVFTTRINLKPGQFYAFDDRWLDFDVMADGMGKPVRVIELSSGDVFSGKTVSWDLIPLVEDDDGKREQIKTVHMLLLLANVLCVVGYHKDGVTLMVEHGTAAIPHWLEMLLCRLSGGITEEAIENGRTVERIVKPGLIRVERSGIQGGVSFGGGFPTGGKGNFRFKAALESTHALKHSVTADLPAQVGKNGRTAPVEEAYGRKAWAVKMIKKALGMRQEVLQFVLENVGGLTFRQAYWAIHQMFQVIHADHHHNLEGFAEAGLETCEYRLKNEEDAWLPMTELAGYPEAQRLAIDAFIRSTDWASRKRFLSREEAWQRGVNDLVRLPAHCIPQILGPEFAKLRPDLCCERTVRDDNTIQVKVQAIGNDPLYFSSICQRPNGTPKQLTPGKSYRTVISPLDTKTLHISDLEGRYIGTCKFERADRSDEESLQRQFGRAARENAMLTGNVERRTRLRNQGKTAQIERVNNALSGGPVTEAERQLASDREARKAAAQGHAPVAIAAPATPAVEDDFIPDFNPYLPQHPQS